MEPNTFVGPVGATTKTEPKKEVSIRFCLYARKSTESDEKQALSIDSQVKEMLAIAKRDGLRVVDIRRESFSSKTATQRPVFNKMLEDIRSDKFNAIIAWAPDRLSRNAGDLGALVDLMDQEVLIEIRTYGQKFQNAPNDKFMLMILGSQAKLENDQKGVNVKRGLRARCEMGLWPSEAPTGYLNYHQDDKKCEVFVDPKRGPYIKTIFDKFVYEEKSGRDVYHWLKHDVDFRTKNNKHLSLSNIYKILNAHFYYGIFEYPGNSGNWYQGRHEPLISKELFDKAQERLALNRSEHEIKRNDFAFTKLMRCGLCSSGISAQEKFKYQQNGNVHRYVYYGCSKGKDRFCKSKFIEEKEVIKQITDIIDKLNLDKVNLGYKLKKEIERYSHFQSKILGIPNAELKKKGNVDIKNYAKYLLKEGNIVEKREMLECLKSKLVLKDKKISLE